MNLETNPQSTFKVENRALQMKNSKELLIGLNKKSKKNTYRKSFTIWMKSKKSCKNAHSLHKFLKALKRNHKKRNKKLFYNKINWEMLKNFSMTKSPFSINEIKKFWKLN